MTKPKVGIIIATALFIVGIGIAAQVFASEP